MFRSYLKLKYKYRKSLIVLYTENNKNMDHEMIFQYIKIT
jgi:hypothetical protein